MKLYDIQEEEEYEHAVPFKIRNPRFVNDTAKEIFERVCNQLLEDVIRTGKALKAEPQENNGNFEVFEKLCLLPENQQKSALSKVGKIIYFQLGKSQEPSDRFQETLYHKLINLRYADLIGKPLRVSRSNNQQDGSGSYAKFNMNYDEFFVIDDLLSVLGIVEQHIPVDGQKEEKIFQTRVQLTDHGRSLLVDDNDLSILSYQESANDFKEVVMTINKTRKIKCNKTNRQKEENYSVPIPYVVSDHILRIIKRVRRINQIYEKQQLTVKHYDIELSLKEVNKLLTQHINGDIEITKLHYSYKPFHFNCNPLYTRIINVINSSALQCGKGTPVRERRERTEGMESGGGTKGNNSIMYNDNNYISCQNDNTSIIVHAIEFRILKIRVHRVYSRNSWSLHGRYYGFWANMNGIFRSNIYLNDSTEPMVSLDFSAMHQSLAYHLSGLECDPASIYEIDSFDKELIKHIALVAMNVKRSKGKQPYQGALQAIRDNVCEKHGVTYKEAKAAFYKFMEKHDDIESFICSDFGIKAMYYESMILDNCMYQLMIKEGIIILPVHDELLCPSDAETVEKVKKQMVESYRKVIKEVLVQRKVWNRSTQQPEQMKPSIKQD